MRMKTKAIMRMGGATTCNNTSGGIRQKGTGEDPKAGKRGVEGIQCGAVFPQLLPRLGTTGLGLVPLDWRDPERYPKSFRPSTLASKGYRQTKVVHVYLQSIPTPGHESQKESSANNRTQAKAVHPEPRL